MPDSTTRRIKNTKLFLNFCKVLLIISSRKTKPNQTVCMVINIFHALIILISTCLLYSINPTFTTLSKHFIMRIWVGVKSTPQESLLAFSFGIIGAHLVIIFVDVCRARRSQPSTKLNADIYNFNEAVFRRRESRPETEEYGVTTNIKFSRLA